MAASRTSTRRSLATNGSTERFHRASSAEGSNREQARSTARTAATTWSTSIRFLPSERSRLTVHVDAIARNEVDCKMSSSAVGTGGSRRRDNCRSGRCGHLLHVGGLRGRRRRRRRSTSRRDRGDRRSRRRLRRSSRPSEGSLSSGDARFECLNCLCCCDRGRRRRCHPLRCRRRRCRRRRCGRN